MEIVEAEDYYYLCSQLHLIPFYSDFWLDDNILKRIDALRDEMEDDFDGSDDEYSVFEVLVGLSVLIEEQIMSSFWQKSRVSKWFFEMISNLGLEKMDDFRWNSSLAEAVEDVCETFLNRSYGFDGRGGNIFVVKNPPKPLKDIDLWLQANLYFGQKYRKNFELEVI